MGERRINPRFNVNKIYKNVNIINPYRFGAGGGGGGSYDADAQAFIDAVATLSTAQEEAIDDLVVGLKANGTWSKYHAIYPFIGGTASAHKWNLKDPRDLDAAFRLTFSGTLTHSSTGVKGDASTGYGNSHYNPTTNGTSENVMLGYYSRDDISEASLEIGYIPASLATSPRLYLRTGFNGGVSGYDCYDGGSGRVSASYTGTDGYFVGSRLSASDSKLFKNGSQVGSITTSGGSVPNDDLYLFSLNGGGSPLYYSSKEGAFAVIGLGLTATEVANDYTTIQAYQTALGRNV